MAGGCRCCRISVLFVLVALLAITQDKQHCTCGALTSSTKPLATTTTTTTRRSSSISSSSTTLLGAKKWVQRPYWGEDDHDHEEDETERPTQTRTERYRPSVSPAKPKIVVLGASGRIGRLVVRQLMESSLDCTVVAIVRDSTRASKLFYGENHMASAAKTTKGPQLQVMEADLVPDESLPGYTDPDAVEDEEDWKTRAESAAAFYGNAAEDYDNSENDFSVTSVHEILETAIRDCTSIISCVGAVRPTNVWSDWLRVPLFRLLKRDVSSWCRDKRHPYYVHYGTTRQVLGLAEREQRRRLALAQVEAEEDFGNKDSIPNRVPRIRLVRISDLCVAQRAWDFVPLVTNIVQSMVFRYQEMAERILEESEIIDTVVLRPGDLMDEERDPDTTSLQVDCSGKVPCPARVGRADVAALAVASALFTSNEDAAAAAKKEKTKSASSNRNNGISQKEEETAFHYVLGVRWAGQDLHPFPPQGHKEDGLENANQCIRRVLQTEAQKAKRQRRIDSLRQTSSNISWPWRRPRRPLKPYGVCVAIISYLFLALMLTTITKSVLAWVPGGEHVRTMLERVRSMAWEMVQTLVPKPAAPVPVVPPPKRVRFRPIRGASKDYISF